MIPENLKILSGIFGIAVVMSISIVFGPNIIPKADISIPTPDPTAENIFLPISYPENITTWITSLNDKNTIALGYMKVPEKISLPSGVILSKNFENNTLFSEDIPELKIITTSTAESSRYDAVNAVKGITFTPISSSEISLVELIFETIPPWYTEYQIQWGNNISFPSEIIPHDAS